MFKSIKKVNKIKKRDCLNKTGLDFPFLYTGFQYN